MKRILVFGITENPGGVEAVVMNYYRHINKENYQFDFLCNTKIVAYEKEILSYGGEIYRICARSVNRKLYQKQMKSFFEKNARKYCAIWVNVCSLANIDYLKYAKQYGIGTRVIHSHNSQNMEGSIRKLMHVINKKFVKKYATDYWACSSDAADWFYRDCNVDVKIINNAIDVDKFKYNENVRNKYRRERGYKDDTIVLGHVGRLHFQKNQLFLLEIFIELVKINTNVRLILVGQGEDENEIRKFIRNNNLENYVELLGVRDDIEGLMQMFDIFVFPSVFEGLGLVLVEAQGSGLPIVASRHVIPHLVKMQDDFTFEDLNNSIEQWVKDILELDKSVESRRIRKNYIKENNYDIKEEVNKLEMFFANLK